MEETEQGSRHLAVLKKHSCFNSHDPQNWQEELHGTGTALGDPIEAPDKRT